MSEWGYLHSIQSLGTVDGPGVRSVVFLSGCPLRCAYCHNPDTWTTEGATRCRADEIVDKLRRFFPYIREGGVTFSGGEPCVQAAFVREVAEALHREGLHTALDTSGALWNETVDEMLRHIDLALLDIKMTTEEDYARHIGGSLADAMAFLQRLEERGIPTWIRHVVVPGLNDSEEDMARLHALIAPYSVVEKVELLPFKNLCLEKYRALGIPFRLESTSPMSGEEWQAFCRKVEAR